MNRKMPSIVLMISVLVLASLACQAVSRATDIDSSDTPTPQAGKQPISQPTKIPQAGKQPTAQPVSGEPQEIRQWAVSAKASSQYGESSWNAEQAIGAPNVTDCGDNGLAWASENSTSGLDWIELTYATPVIPTEINIYQSYNPSQVVEVDMIDTAGTTYTAWQGSPKKISTCPDLMTITFDEKQEMLVEKVVVIVDQSILGLGWNEIDAVELVGIGEGGQPIDEPAATVEASQNAVVPDTYTGWMAGSAYQGYLKVIVGETRGDELNGLIEMKGKKSTENWKPRPSHADTFIFDFGKDDMRAFISVTTDGIVYSKSISPNTHPADFQLMTVKKATYDQLDAIYKRDQAVPYNVMANMLGHPGFMSEQVLREDGRLETHYQWYAANGDRIIGIFFDDVITGIAGLAYIPK
jgi:hypothetical protein